MSQRKYQDLFDDKDVKRWYDNVSRGAVATADIYLRRLGSFCQTNRTTPKKLVKMKDGELYNLVIDTVSAMEPKYAGSYVESSIKAVRSWLAHNQRALKGKVKIRGARDTPTLKDERVPTKEELKRIFLSGDKKTRTATALISQAGLRPEVLGNYKGVDGLRVKDLPEVTIDNNIVEFTKIPTQVVVRKELSKGEHQYFSFLTEEGCTYLGDYLEERVRDGEKLGRESPVITPKLRVKPFVRAVNIGDMLRLPIRKAGFPWRPYVLRSYFDTQLMLAESKGMVIRDYRQFWMGHVGDIENRYTTNKRRLPEQVIEDMREAFSKGQGFLQTEKSEGSSVDQLRIEFKRMLLATSGYRDDEITGMDLENMTNEQIQEKARERLMGAMVNNGQRQRIIATSELEQHIRDGWEFVASPSGLEGKSIIRLPE